MGQHKNMAYRDARKSDSPATRRTRKSRNRAWGFQVEPDGFQYTVYYPDGSTTVVDMEAIAESNPEYFTVQLKKEWPQTEPSFNPPIVLRNPLESAFFDVFLRMTPEGHRAWQRLPFPYEFQANYHLRACLCLIGSIGYGEVLQTYAEPLHSGTITIPELMARIDSQRMAIRTAAQGDGWFVQRWNLLKEQAGIKSAV